MTPDGFCIHSFDTVDSTQTRALKHLKSALAAGGDAAESVSGHLIMAHHQTHGRGRNGRVWETPPTGNLAATLIWRLGQGDDHGARARLPGDYSLIVAVALADTVASYLHSPEKGRFLSMSEGGGGDFTQRCGVTPSVTLAGDTSSPFQGEEKNISIKWPNDILIGGAKVSGILIEHPEPGWLLIGTGVNLASAPDGRVRMYDFCDPPGPTSREFLNAYLARFKKWTAIYNCDGLGPICDEWMSRAFGVDLPMTVRLPNAEFSAIFRGLDRADGACLAEIPDGSIRRVLSGEVFF